MCLLGNRINHLENQETETAFDHFEVLMPLNNQVEKSVTLLVRVIDPDSQDTTGSGSKEVFV